MLINRPAQYFTYVMDYLQNGGQLPPNLPTDEAELRRVQEEFDYFLLPAAFGSSPPTLLQAIKENKVEAEFLESIVPAEQREDVAKAVLNERYAWILWTGPQCHVEVWDLETGAQAALPVESPDFEPKWASASIVAATHGASLAYTPSSTDVRILDVSDGEVRAFWSPTLPGCVEGLALSDDWLVAGSRNIVDSEGLVSVVSRQSGEIVYTLSSTAPTVCLHNSFLYYCGTAGYVTPLDLSTEASGFPYLAHGRVASVGVCNEGQNLMVVSWTRDEIQDEERFCDEDECNIAVCTVYSVGSRDPVANFVVSPRGGENCCLWADPDDTMYQFGESQLLVQRTDAYFGDAFLFDVFSGERVSATLPALTGLPKVSWETRTWAHGQRMLINASPANKREASYKPVLVLCSPTNY